jgi:YidC/Oxa1 family membrane protein insertase
MDQKRLFLAIAISLAIVISFQMFTPRHKPVVDTKNTPTHAVATPTANVASPGTQPVTVPAPRDVPRLKIDAPRVQGSINLMGAQFDRLLLRDYHDTVDPNSPLVEVLEPRADPQPYYAQFGWSAAAGQTIGGQPVRVPDQTTLWTASAPELTAKSPVTLSWDNGQGLTFQLLVAIDADYMFTVQQRVVNKSGGEVKLFPWSRIRRDYTPETAGYYLLHEGFVGVLGGTLQELTYAKSKSEGASHDGVALRKSDDGGWAGITDKYWLTALIPDQASAVTGSYRHLLENDADRYQVDFVTDQPETVAPGAQADYQSRFFAGAKEVHLLDHYQAEYKIPLFYKAVDFGWFWFLTRPIFFALDWLNTVLGNFGLAIMVFTLGVKILFFPLANKSYRSMSKMKLLGPKMTALRERYKDDPAKLQQEMMQLYKTEKVNPASGCLPMVVQIPVFFCLYKDIFVTIEMRHAPFFGWIRDLSVPDPTNIFNLFGLLPFDPTHVAPLLHLGVWPLIMGCTMYFQQRLNPPPPDPMQARLFQFMPVIFTFMLARFPAGLVIYWSWNNTLTIIQQSLIMRRTRLDNPRRAQVTARPSTKRT